MTEDKITPDKEDALRQEGAAEMRDWVLRILSDCRADILVSLADADNELDRFRFRHFEIALSTLAEEIEMKTHMRVFDLLARTKQEGFSLGILTGIKEADDAGVPAISEKLREHLLPLRK